MGLIPGSGRSSGREDPLEEEMVTRSSILAWRILWTEEPGGLQSVGLHRVGHDWSNLARMLLRWRRSKPYISLHLGEKGICSFISLPDGLYVIFKLTFFSSSRMLFIITTLGWAVMCRSPQHVVVVLPLSPGASSASWLFCPWETESQDRALFPQPCVRLVTAGLWPQLPPAHQGGRLCPRSIRAELELCLSWACSPLLATPGSSWGEGHEGFSDFRLLGSQGKSGPASDGAEGRVWRLP